MKRQDIDFQDYSIKIIGKGDKERKVYINAKCRVHLLKYLMSRLDSCESVFVTERRPTRPMGNRAIQKEIKTIAIQSGIKKDIYPHLIRHTFATHMLNAGMSLTVLQKILGHISPETTLVYSKLYDGTVKHEYQKYS